MAHRILIIEQGVGREGQKIVAETIADPEVRQHHKGRLWGLWDRVSTRAKWSTVDDWINDVDMPTELEALRRLSSTIAEDS